MIPRRPICILVLAALAAALAAAPAHATTPAELAFKVLPGGRPGIATFHETGAEISDLTDDQAWEVLEEVGRKHDAELGISWTTLEVVADDLFPGPTSE